MKKKRLITSEEKELLMHSKIKSTWSLGILFYIMTIILPLLTCILITHYYVYCYLLVIFGLVLLLVMLGYPWLWKYHIKNNDIYCYESKVLSCKPGDIYYYLVEINGMDDNFIDYRFPVALRLKRDTEVVVVMLLGKRKYQYYYLLDKNSKRVLTSKRTRFDLID